MRTLHGGGQPLSCGRVVCVVHLPPFRLHPASIDEVAEAAAVVVQPGVGHRGRLGGRAVLQRGENGANGGTTLS